MDRSDRNDSVHQAREHLATDVEAMVADVEHEENGFFGPGSLTWRVNREAALGLSGVSTVLLQLAHPLVAAGVAHHSRFDEAPVGRFRRTSELVGTVVFGDVDAAVEAARAIRSIHDRVTGTLDEAVGPFPAGTRYAASDPDLLLWVHATLIDQALTAYETYVAPLTDAERSSYYQENKAFGRLFDVPEGAYPETLADFYDYYERKMATEIAVGRRGRELQRTLFDTGPLLGPLYAFLGASTLPDPVRAAFGLPWTARRQRLFERWAAFVRAISPALPDRVRYADEYLRARSRSNYEESAQ